MSTVLSAKELSIGYSNSHGRKKEIASALSFDIFEGEVISLLGRNGAGKSTLIKTLCGFIPSLGGAINLFGKQLKEYSQSDLSTKVGVVLTDKVSAGGVTVRDLVSLGRYPHTGFFGRLTENDYEMVNRSLEAVGMQSEADSFLAEISDGQRQKAFVAKALAQECPLIILDEPTAFLDYPSRMELMALLSKVAKEENRSVVVSTHDLDLACRYSDRILILTEERGLLDGTPASFTSDGTLSRMFGY